MRGYDREEVEEYDEYEDEGEEQYEVGEEEEEEERKPTEEELEYLELRKRLKERYRKNLKKESGSGLNSSHEKKNRLPFDNYGSFFGPSQPVISQRVIQESKSLLETEHLASRLSNSYRNNEKISASSASKVGVQRKPPKVNELQRKVEKIKVSRDYSFLADDAELQAPKKELPARNVSAPNSEAGPAQLPLKSKQSVSNGGKHVRGAYEERKSVSSNRKIHSEAGLYKSTSGNKSNLMSVDPRKQHSSNNGTGPGRPVVPKAPSSKMPMASMEKKPSAPGAKNQLPIAKNQLPIAKNQLPIAKNQLPIAKNQSSSTMMPPSSKILQPVQKKHLEQRNGFTEPNRSKPISKQPVASSKPKINKPVKQISSHATTQDHRPKKKPLRRYADDEDGDDDAKAFSMLRSILGPRKYASYDDDDDSDMEAGFDDIMKEERLSAKIARREDEEQLRLIEEEERQERIRKLAKKRKPMS